MVYQRYCFVSLIFRELISNTSSIRHRSLQKGSGIYHSLNDQTTDQRRISLPPASEFFKTIWKPPIQSYIQFWAQGARSSWGFAHRGIPKHCSNEEYSINNCQRRHYLITQMSFKPVYLEAKILHFPRKQKSVLQKEWVFPRKTRGISPLFLSTLSPCFPWEAQFAPAPTHTSTNTPRYGVLIHSQAQRVKPSQA